MGVRAGGSSFQPAIRGSLFFSAEFAGFSRFGLLSQSGTVGGPTFSRVSGDSDAAFSQRRYGSGCQKTKRRGAGETPAVHR